MSETSNNFVTREFSRVKTAYARDYLVLDEVLDLQPPSTVPIHFNHLGILYALDPGLSGIFRIQCFMNFREILRERMEIYRAYEFETKSKGYFTMCLWAACMRRGRGTIINWIVEVVRCNGDVVQFENDETEYIMRDSIMSLHRLFSIGTMYFQDFFDTIQRHAEAQDKLDILSPQFDDVVPISSVKSLAKDIVVHFVEIMHQMGFSESLLQIHHKPDPTMTSPTVPDNE